MLVGRKEGERGHEFEREHGWRVGGHKEKGKNYVIKF